MVIPNLRKHILSVTKWRKERSHEYTSRLILAHTIQKNNDTSRLVHALNSLEENGVNTNE